MISKFPFTILRICGYILFFNTKHNVHTLQASKRYSNFNVLFVFPLNVVLRIQHTMTLLFTWQESNHHKKTNTLQLFCYERVMELITLLYFAIKTLPTSIHRFYTRYERTCRDQENPLQEKAISRVEKAIRPVKTVGSLIEMGRSRKDEAIHLEPVIDGIQSSSHIFHSIHSYSNGYSNNFGYGYGAYGYHHSGECR